MLFLRLLEPLIQFGLFEDCIKTVMENEVETSLIGDHNIHHIVPRCT